VDEVIAQAKEKGETLAFRIVAEFESGTPRWLLDKGIASVKESDGVFPDYNNPIFLDYHERLIRAFGERYGGSPDIDHVDIGSVGCWGEWNVACCVDDVRATCQAYYPTEPHQVAITDSYFKYFAGTPLVMLHNGQLRYAASRGAGWRGDCYGDYGYFSPTWNHMEHAYAPALENPIVADAWKRGPVQLEVCGYIQDWYDKQFDLDRILQKGLEWHVSVLNGKSNPVPAAWRKRFEEFQKRIGYRFVLRQMTHPSRVVRGSRLSVRTQWENVGVAPIYHEWPLAYRLRSESGAISGPWLSSAQLRKWLPDMLHETSDVIELPAGVEPGSYALDVAILDQEQRQAHVELAIEGKLHDRWYAVSHVTISE
jgi:hypothetical protein